jgi:PAS domain-containing protein
MDMGTRKTATALLEWALRVESGDISDLLIIAPAGCYRNWTVSRGDKEHELSEVDKHLNPALRERIAVGTYRSGMGIAERQRLERVLAWKGPRIVAVNVEALSTTQAAREVCERMLERRRCMMVVDESPIIKNPETARTGICMDLGDKAASRRILTGLLAPNGPMDVYAQFQFLDWRIIGMRSFYGFRAKYAITRTMHLPGQMKFNSRTHRLEPKTTMQIVGYRNQDELAERVASRSFRVRKGDVLTQLAPKVYLPPREVDLTDEQRRVYKELKQLATSQLELGGWVTPSLPITMMLRLHQVLCGHVTDDEGIVRPVAHRRIETLLSALSEHPRKGIIWCCYDFCIREVSEALRREYGSKSVAQFWGGNRSTRAEDEARFRGDPDCRWMVASQAAGGRGNTWVVADLNYYYAYTQNLDHHAQSEDRTHRDGQDLSATYGTLLVPKTVEEKFLHALREKIDLAAVINQDNWHEWIV